MISARNAAWDDDSPADHFHTDVDGASHEILVRNHSEDGEREECGDRTEPSQDYVYSRALDSAKNYEIALDTHINPPAPTSGSYIPSSTGGRVPIQGISKFFNTQLRDEIIANTGAPLSKHLTSHVLRRTVATRLAEVLGDEGDKLIKRVLGCSDGSVTAIYNRYGYVREMRRALVKWADELTTETEVRVFGATVSPAA